MKKNIDLLQRAKGDGVDLLLVLAFLSCIAALLLGSGCAKSNPNTPLVIYAAGPRDLAEFLCQKYEEKTGTKTTLFCATTGEIMAKLQAEEARPQADVVILAGQTAAEVLKEQGDLAPLPPGDYLRMNPAWNDSDGYYAATAGTALGIAVRKDHYDPKLEWDDVFNGAVDGGMLMPSQSQSGSSAEFVVNFALLEPDKFWKWIDAAKSHGLQVSGPNSQALTGLVLGAQTVVIAAADYLVFRQIEKGEPLVMHFPASGCPLSLRPVAILKGSRNKPAADAFVKFCFSPAAQQEIAAGHLLPADPTVELSALRQTAPPLHPLLVDVHAARREQGDALQRFQTEIESGTAAASSP